MLCWQINQISVRCAGDSNWPQQQQDQQQEQQQATETTKSTTFWTASKSISHNLCTSLFRASNFPMSICFLGGFAAPSQAQLAAFHRNVNKPGLVSTHTHMHTVLLLTKWKLQLCVRRWEDVNCKLWAGRQPAKELANDSWPTSRQPAGSWSDRAFLILFAEFVISLNLHINQGILITLTPQWHWHWALTLTVALAMPMAKWRCWKWANAKLKWGISSWKSQID